MDVITVLTCPGRPDYLLPTLTQLDAAGATDCDRKLVCSDGPMHGPCPWPVNEKTDGPSGIRRAKWWVLQQALELGANRLIYCEDDLTVATDAIRKVRACHVADDHAFASFYDYKETHMMTAGQRATRGLHSIPIFGLNNRGMWGSLCLLIPRRTIEWVLQRGPFEWADPWPEKVSAGDSTFVWALRDSPWKLRHVHVPSLVDHAGEVSTKPDMRPGRRAFMFTGE